MQTQLHTDMIEMCVVVVQMKHSHVKRHSTGVPLKEVDVTACYLHSCLQQHQMISE